MIVVLPQRLPALVTLTVALLLGLGGAASAQTPEPPAGDAAPSEVFFERVDVRLVNIEVWVSDKQGEPVTDLQKEDFELYEDGRQVEITNFYSTHGVEPRATPSAPGAAVDEVPLEAAGGTEPLGRLGTPDDQRLHLVVYVDNYNLRLVDRNRVFRNLRAFLLDHVTDEDRVMLVSNERSLRVRHPFTNDSSLIARALIDMETETAHGNLRDRERSDLLDRIDRTQIVSQAAGDVRLYAESITHDMRLTMGSLRELMDSLAGLPGRKALIYLSSGLPMNPGQDMFEAVNQKYSDSSVLTQVHDFNLNRDFQQLTYHANTTGVTFYTIDAGGLRVSSASDVERAGGTGFTSLSSIDSTHYFNLQSSVIYMARATGGTAIYNTNNPGPGLDRIARDLRTYYSLGFAPAHVDDGRYHKLEIKVKRKGLEVRHRDGYRDRSADDLMSDATRSVLQYGFESNPLEARIEIGSGAATEQGRYLMPIVVHVPMANLAFIERERHQVGGFRLFIGAMDDGGDLADIQEVPVRISIPLDEFETARNRAYRYEVKLLMRGGGHRVAVGVRDELGGAESFLTKTLVAKQG